MGALCEKQGSSKEEARIKQGPGKEEFSKEHSFCPSATPRYGGLLLTNKIQMKG
jgi:hypothetical protein